MSSSSAAKGKRFEHELREGLRGYGFDVEALRLAGTEDEGDLLVRPGSVSDVPVWTRIVMEAKNTVAIDLAGHTKEALVEADNYCNHRDYPREKVLALLIQKRRGLGWKDAYVVTTVREFFGLE